MADHTLLQQRVADLSRRARALDRNGSACLIVHANGYGACAPHTGRDGGVRMRMFQTPDAALDALDDALSGTVLTLLRGPGRTYSDVLDSKGKSA